MGNSRYKFRAWDKNERTMHPVSSLSPKFIMVPKSPNQRSRNDCDIMQYTGLKDKNGVDIYEGDIVTRFGGGIFEISYSNAAFHLKAIKPLQEVNSILEVIGNIHQHPHLLGEKK